MHPSKVLSPKSHIAPSSLKVFYIHPDGWWSLARMHYDGEERIGIRWNGEIDNPSDLGHPVSTGHATWFLLPTELGEPVAQLATLFSKSRE
ncbi:MULTISPECIES: hypothetical protein [Acetobacteraceae]|uniref:Uncharacterized protein n=1 Tax=Gluconobacter japonicus TaxID=376620 RepID=A0A9Q2FP33_GLUJA|nr:MULTISPECIES: hypothetical protein [Acetobacteraceae]MBF0872110.1 hypothetical protein [Gluconobacter japonicus]